MWACVGVMCGAIKMAGNGRGYKTRLGVWSWGCVFCEKAVWGGGGYLVVGRLQVSFYTLYIAV